MRWAALLAAAALLALGSAPAALAQTTVFNFDSGACAEDLTGDGFVSTNDLLYLLASYGRSAATEPAAAWADLDGVRAPCLTDPDKPPRARRALIARAWRRVAWWIRRTCCLCLRLCVRLPSASPKPRLPSAT